jgi:hypothetical protein
MTKQFIKGVNSDGEQIHQYQQREQSPLTLTHEIDKGKCSLKSRSWFGTALQCFGIKPVNS